MALPTSGSISWQAIQDEHGGSHPISISEYYGKYNVSNVQSPTSGPIVASDLHGTSPSINGGWSAWSAYGSCSVSCGGGTKTRTRTCTNPSPAYGGNACSGSSTDSASCNTQSCFNATWSGNSIYYRNWGLYVSGNLCRMYVDGGTGAWITAYTNRTFSNTISDANRPDDFSKIRGHGNSTLRAAYNSSTWATTLVTLGSGGFTGSSVHNNYRGLQTSGGLLRLRNGNRYSNYISIN